jgi:hypothetical protein
MHTSGADPTGVADSTAAMNAAVKVLLSLHAAGTQVGLLG